MDYRYGLSIVDYKAAEDTDRLVGQFCASDLRPVWISVVRSGGGRRSYSMSLRSNVPVHETVAGFNTGYGVGHNIAIDAARSHPSHLAADAFLLLNPDIRISDVGALVSSMSQATREDPRIGALSPIVTNADGQTWYAGATLDRERAGFPSHESELGEGLGSGSRTLTDYACGAAMFVQRAAYDLVGGLSEHLFLYFEEADFSCRLRSQGYTSVVDGSTVVAHDRTWSVPPPYYIYYFVRNFHLFAYTFQTGSLESVRQALRPWASSQRRRVITRHIGAGPTFDATMSRAIRDGQRLVSGQSYDPTATW